VRPRRRALAGHHHELVPHGEHLDRVEVGQLGQAVAQLLDLVQAHGHLHRGERLGHAVDPADAVATDLAVRARHGAHEAHPARQAIKFFAVSLVAYGFTYAVLISMVDGAGVSKELAQATGAGLTVVSVGARAAGIVEREVARHAGSAVSITPETRSGDPASVLQLGIAHATAQCIDLVLNGAPGVHLYTLNRSTAARQVLTAIRASGVVSDLPQSAAVV